VTTYVVAKSVISLSDLVSYNVWNVLRVNDWANKVAKAFDDITTLIFVAVVDINVS